MDLQRMQNLTQGMKDIKNLQKEESDSDSTDNAEILNFLGVGFYNVKDYDRAFDAFRQAAEKGCVSGMVNLGECYFDGEGTAQNFYEGLRWFRQAANLGNTKAMLYLASCYYLGKGGLEENPALAFSWCRKAAEGGYPIAMHQVANMYFEGDGVIKNFELGMEWLVKAADAGDVDSMTELAYKLENSDDLDLKKLSIQYYLEAAKNEDLTAINNLGCIFYDGMPGVIAVDRAEAKKLFEIAAEAGHVPSMINLAKTLESYGDNDGYRYWYRKAAQNGSEQAQSVVQSWENSSGCFITTAVCESFGKPDDCYELTAFRNFRDNWLANESDGKSLIAEYYSIAPKIVAKINMCLDAAEIYCGIWENYLKPCLKFIESGEYIQCKFKYIEMVMYLKNLYMNKSFNK